MKSTKDLVYIALSVAIIVIGAFIKIPSPFVGFFTLQLPCIYLIAVILGKKRALIAMCIYIVGGLIGIPWFAAGGGFMYILQPTFGFLLGFLIASYIVGLTEYLKKPQGFLLGIIVTIIIWVIGMLYYSFILQNVSGKDFGYMAALITIICPDFYMDIILGFISISIGYRVKKSLNITKIIAKESN